MRRLWWVCLLAACDDGGGIEPAGDAAPALDRGADRATPDDAALDAAGDRGAPIDMADQVDGAPVDRGASLDLAPTPDLAPPLDLGVDPGADMAPDAAPPPLPLAPLLTEIVASNQTGPVDEDGDRPDWIELYNPHPTPVRLGEFALSDGGDRWILPAAELAPHAYALVFASGKDRREAFWHADFRLAAEGEPVTLSRLDGSVVQRFDPTPLGPDEALGLPAVTLLGADAAVRSAGPGDDAGWTAPDFDDAAWALTPQGIGARAAVEPSPLAHQLDHLLADWRFDLDPGGRVIDGSGQHPGDLAGGAALVDTARSGAALGGASGWMAAADPEAFDFNAAFTWSLWFKGVDASGALISRNPAGTAWNQGSKALFVRGGTLQWDSGWVGNPRTGVNVTDDRWRHVAVTYTPEGDRFRIYIDGVSVVDQAFDVDRFAEDAVHNGGQARTGLFVGQANFSGGLPSLDKYEGLIDDVTLWRVALPPEDVALLAAGVRPGPVDPYGDRLQTARPAGTPAGRIRLGVPQGFAPHLGVEVDPGAAWWVDGVARAPLAAALDGPSWHGLPVGARVVALAVDAAERWMIRARIAGLADTPRRLAAPTPGAFNAQAVAPAVEFSRGDGIFAEPFALTLEAPSGAIHFTLDGSAPTAQSPQYAGPILIEATGRVRARVFEADHAPGPIGEAAFLQATAAFLAEPRPLPVLVLARLEQGAATRSDTPALLFEFAPDAAEPVHGSRAVMRIRGQSSANQPKKPYRVELRDAEENDRALPLLGMPAEADWVLHAPYTDQSLIRNALVYGLGHAMGMTAPRSAHCELYVQQSGAPLDVSHRQGVYLLVESIEPGADRLDLSDAGYLLKFEAGVAQPPVVGGYTSLELDRPDPASPEQVEWITDHLAAFEAALEGPDFASPVGYAAYIDEASFIDQLVINELFRDQDAYVRSAWLHLEPDGPIVMGPLWDYNLSAGTGGYFENTATAGWQWQHRYNRGEHGWFARLMADPAFAARFADRWRALRAGLLSDAALNARIDALAAVVEPGVAANFARWSTLGQGRINGFTSPVANTWAGQIQALRDWLAARAAWIDGQLQ